MYLCLDLLILMSFLFKKHTSRKGKQELVYQGNRLLRKEDKRKWNGKKENSVARKEDNPSSSIAIKKGMMRTIVGNCIPRRDQSWFKERKGRKIVATKT
jgi:hypothetical protein